LKVKKVNEANIETGYELGLRSHSLLLPTSLPFSLHGSLHFSRLSASYQSAFDIFNWNFMKIYSILN